MSSSSFTKEESWSGNRSKVQETDPEKVESPLLKEEGGMIENSNNTEGSEGKKKPSFSEWQIRLGGNAAFPSKHCKGWHFRNHDTGESILPAKVYMNLLLQVCALKSGAKGKIGAQVKIHCLLLVLYLAVIIGPLFIINAILKPSANYKTGGASAAGAATPALVGIAVAILVLAIMAMAFTIGILCLNRIYKTLDSQAQALVDERRDEFLETYGIDLGYQCHNDSEKYRLFNDNSHVWLRRPRQQEEEILVEEAPGGAVATARSSGSPNTPHEEFPPIYLSPLVPGDIHIHEEEYHSSIGLDKETWTLIQNTHRETIQKVNPNMSRLVLFSFFMIPYAVLAPVIGLYIGVGGYWCGLLLYFGVMYVLSRIVTRQYLQAQQKVAETVTRILLLRDLWSNHCFVHWSGRILVWFILVLWCLVCLVSDCEETAPTSTTTSGRNCHPYLEQR